MVHVCLQNIPTVVASYSKFLLVWSPSAYGTVSVLPARTSAEQDCFQSLGPPGRGYCYICEIESPQWWFHHLCCSCSAVQRISGDCDWFCSCRFSMSLSISLPDSSGSDIDTGWGYFLERLPYPDRIPLEGCSAAANVFFICIVFDIWTWIAVSLKWNKSTAFQCIWFVMGCLIATFVHSVKINQIT